MAKDRLGFNYVSSEEYEIAALKAEIEQWKTWGIIEIAVRNPNVASYMEEWESRAIKAEAQLATLSLPPNGPLLPISEKRLMALGAAHICSVYPQPAEVAEIAHELWENRAQLAEARKTAEDAV
jgi:hypothetical protein